METRRVEMDPLHLNEEAILLAGKYLKEGKLVAFPTETVYGLGANALDKTAAEKTYLAKGRPSDNPLIVHISQFEDIFLLVSELQENTTILASKFWPGPLTLICKKSEVVPEGVTGGLDTVAIRMPDHPIALALIKAGGGYVSAPSANSSGSPSPTTADHVMRDLYGKVDMIIDGGEVEIGVESTILDMTTEPPMILRPGAITRCMLEQVIGHVDIDESVSVDSDIAPKAPGMKYRHYAPQAPLYLVKGNQEDVCKAICYLLQKGQKAGKSVGVMATDETRKNYNGGVLYSLGSVESQAEVAHNLYAVLREFDRQKVDIIYSESFYEEGLGAAIMNRLEKAAGQYVLEADEILKRAKNEGFSFQ